MAKKETKSKPKPQSVKPKEGKSKPPKEPPITYIWD